MDLYESFLLYRIRLLNEVPLMPDQPHNEVGEITRVNFQQQAYYSFIAVPLPFRFTSYNHYQ